MAEVLSIDTDEKYIDENGAFEISKCNLIAYANGSYYSLGRKIGKFGYSVMKKVSNAKNIKTKKKSNKKENNSANIHKKTKLRNGKINNRKNKR